MFIKNKYQKWYFKLIKHFKNRHNELINFEVHHIIPKSLNGTNYKNNLIKVSPKEHYILHRLLVKFTKNEANQKMKSALYMMSLSNKQLSRYYVYRVKNRKELLKNHNYQKGSKNSNYNRIWIKFDELKVQMKIPLLETFEYIEQGWNYGRKMSYNSVTKKRNKFLTAQKIKKINKERSKKAFFKYKKIYEDFINSTFQNFSEYCKFHKLSRPNIGANILKRNIAKTLKK